jgi:hypothetical protein
MTQRNMGIIVFLILLIAFASACSTSNASPQTSASATLQPTSSASATNSSDAKKPKEQPTDTVKSKEPKQQPTTMSSSTANAKNPKVQPTFAPASNSDFSATEILGRPTNTSITVNVVPTKNMEIYYEYGTASGNYSNQTSTVTATADAPLESLIDKLAPNARYYYRLRYRPTGAGQFVTGSEHTFVTQCSRLIFKATRIPNVSVNNLTLRSTHARCKVSHPTSPISL